MSWIPPASVHLVVTSPPYWTLKEYAPGNGDQLGHFSDYEHFLSELDRVWSECARVLVGGGRICCVVGDVCIPRKRGGRHHVVPLHSDIQVRARKVGLDCLQPILRNKISNGVMEAQGNGAGFYGKPYQPGGIIKNDVEYILFLQKGGEYRTTPTLQKALSMLTKIEMKTWFRSIWFDPRGASTQCGHPAPYPVELAERLIKMFSFAATQFWIRLRAPVPLRRLLSYLAEIQSPTKLKRPTSKSLDSVLLGRPVSVVSLAQ